MEDQIKTRLTYDAEVLDSRMNWVKIIDLKVGDKIMSLDVTGKKFVQSEIKEVIVVPSERVHRLDQSVGNFGLVRGSILWDNCLKKYCESKDINRLSCYNQLGKFENYLHMIYYERVESTYGIVLDGELQNFLVKTRSALMTLIKSE